MPKKVVSAALKDDLRDRYEKDEPGEGKRSQYLREILRDGFRYRDENIYDRIDLPDELREALEAERRDGESKSSAVKRAVEDGVEARRSDVLDEIAASEGLRERVEALRTDDEDLEAVVRRLVREGAETSTEAAQKRKKAQSWGETFTVSFLLFAIALAIGGEALSTPLPVPLVSVTWETAIGGALFGTLAAYGWYRVRASLAARSGG
jgi:hypothetical protein